MWKRLIDDAMALWANSSRVMGRRCLSIPASLDLRKAAIGAARGLGYGIVGFLQRGSGRPAGEGWL